MAGKISLCNLECEKIPIPQNVVLFNNMQAFGTEKNFVIFLYFVGSCNSTAKLFKLFWSISNGIFKGKIIIKTIFSSLYLLADLFENVQYHLFEIVFVSGVPTVESENLFFERMLHIEDVHNP